MANTTGATMTDELIKRLGDTAAERDRSSAQEYEGNMLLVVARLSRSDANLMLDAKARIEAAEAERDALIAQRDAVPFDINALGMGLEMAAQSTIRIVTKERDEALAYNARLRKVLECLLIEYDYAELAQDEPPSLTAAVFSARDALNTGKADT